MKTMTNDVCSLVLLSQPFSPQCTFLIYDYTSLKTAKNIITVVQEKTFSQAWKIPYSSPNQITNGISKPHKNLSEKNRDFFLRILPTVFQSYYTLESISMDQKKFISYNQNSAMIYLSLATDKSLCVLCKKKKAKDSFDGCNFFAPSHARFTLLVKPKLLLTLGLFSSHFHAYLKHRKQSFDLWLKWLILPTVQHLQSYLKILILQQKVICSTAGKCVSCLLCNFFQSFHRAKKKTDDGHIGQIQMQQNLQLLCTHIV